MKKLIFILMLIICTIPSVLLSQENRPVLKADIASCANPYQIDLNNYVEDFEFYGTHSGTFRINTIGTPQTGMKVHIFWRCNINLAAGEYVIILGDTLSEAEYSNNNRIHAIYSGADWNVFKYRNLTIDGNTADIRAGDTTGQFLSWNNPSSAWDTLGRDALFINTSNYLGVGTKAPSELLSVDGNIVVKDTVKTDILSPDDSTQITVPDSLSLLDDLYVTKNNYTKDTLWIYNQSLLDFEDTYIYGKTNAFEFGASGNFLSSISCYEDAYVYDDAGSSALRIRSRNDTVMFTVQGTYEKILIEADTTEISTFALVGGDLNVVDTAEVGILVTDTIRWNSTISRDTIVRIGDAAFEIADSIPVLLIDSNNFNYTSFAFEIEQVTLFLDYNTTAYPDDRKVEISYGTTTSAVYDMEGTGFCTATADTIGYTRAYLYEAAPVASSIYLSLDLDMSTTAGDSPIYVHIKYNVIIFEE